MHAMDAWALLSGVAQQGNTNNTLLGGPCVPLTPEHATPFLFGLEPLFSLHVFDGVYPTFSRPLERKVQIAQVQTSLFHCDTRHTLPKPTPRPCH
ncbi:Uncharacterized protein HZ326_11092 [Fusarium oxysporum f. sp. albedinis]|nr:Uncharacterized protein HZ326_11092 [Fusarium oxysporum f. sp. albedinis]